MLIGNIFSFEIADSHGYRLPEISLELIVAVCSLSVAAVTVWLGFLKGPDITLYGSPKFDMKKIDWSEIKLIPYAIQFSPAQLIFINEGARSGAIRLETFLRPSKEFDSFFSKHSCLFKRDNEPIWRDHMPYISIPDRESLIIEVEITAEFHDWKDYFDSEPVSKNEIQNILCQADDRNRKRFSDFCSMLKPGMCIGEISIDSMQTMGFLRGLRPKSLLRRAIGNVDQEVIDGFKLCLTKWDDIERYRILKEVQGVDAKIESLLQHPLKDLLTRIENKGPLQEFKSDFWYDLKRSMQGYRLMEKLVDFIFKSYTLESKIKQFGRQADRFNDDLQIYRRLREDLRKKEVKKQEDLLAQSNALKEEIKDLLNEIESLRNVLGRCVPPTTRD